MVFGRSGEFMDTRYGEVMTDCETRREAPLEASLDAMHPLEPPPPDVLLALLARNKALEGECMLQLCTRNVIIVIYKTTVSNGKKITVLATLA